MDPIEPLVVLLRWGVVSMSDVCRLCLSLRVVKALVMDILAVGLAQQAAEPREVKKTLFKRFLWPHVYGRGGKPVNLAEEARAS